MTKKPLKLRKNICKHKNIRRFTTYESGDFYYYHKLCKDCEMESGGWSAEQAENGLFVKLPERIKSNG